jgi:NAD(P)-dependent dehydrogenase (short-subunit alcohol dehydrogenase family)
VPIVLITGAGTGIGNLTARSLARAGHTVYASMRNPKGDHAQELLRWGAAEGLDLRTVALDVQSEESARQAVATVVAEAGQLDVVVHNAGHLAVGYVESFTADDIAHLVDINMLGAQRVNRAVLPHMRERGTGTLLYVGSTSIIDVPPFLGPYVASKAAFDVLAQATRYEVAPLGIESVIVMPGPFTRGTAHFPNASHASDTAVAAGYAVLDPMVARNLEATNSLCSRTVSTLTRSASPTRSRASSRCRSASGPSAALSTSRASASTTSSSRPRLTSASP